MEAEKLTFTKIMRWSEDQCREYLIERRWPDGVTCPHCGADSPYTIERRTKSKNKVQKLFKCRKCRKQFTPMVGTIFHGSKIPLSKWFAAIYLMCASKKGISAHQIHRQLDITYKSAWFLCHRVREAMRDKNREPLTGVIEADETYIGGKTKRHHPVVRERINDEIKMGWRKEKPLDYRKARPIVFGMVERGGKARTMKIDAVNTETVRPIFIQNIDLSNARVMTDSHPAYRLLRKHVRDDTVNHQVEYVRYDIHTQSIENYWSLLKRGITGVFHHIGEQHLDQYLQEFEFSFNRRKISDAERFAELMGQTQGRLSWYCQNPQPEHPRS